MNEAHLPHLINAMTEHELLQSFSSPAQLGYLAARNVFDSQETMQKLRDIHTRYLESPTLLSHLRFPHALHFLHLTLTSPRFRAHLKNPGFIAHLESVAVLTF